MAILNYTTSVRASQSINEIVGKLAAHGASKIMQEYKDGMVIQISFMISTKHGEHAFSLPANIEKVHAHIINTQRVKKRYRTFEDDWLNGVFVCVATSPRHSVRFNRLPTSACGPEARMFQAKE